MPEAMDKSPWPQEKPTEAVMIAFGEDFIDLCRKHKLSAACVTLLQLEAKPTMRVAISGDYKMVMMVRSKFGMPRLPLET